jgi:putative membrane protein
MLAGLGFGSEIKRFGRSRMTRVAIVVLMLLPLVYGALYLWAFWDPFGHVNKLPVALVNSDRGAVVSGQQFNAGTEIAKSLTADRSLDWHVVTAWSTASTTSWSNCRPISVRRSRHR